MCRRSGELKLTLMNKAARACERVAQLDEKVKYLNSRSSQSRALIAALKLGGIWLCIYFYAAIHTMSRKLSFFHISRETEGKSEEKKKSKIESAGKCSDCWWSMFWCLLSLMKWNCLESVTGYCFCAFLTMHICEIAGSKIHRSVVKVKQHAFETLKF